MKDGECCYSCHRIDFGTRGLMCTKFKRHNTNMVWDYLKHYIKRFKSHYVSETGYLIPNEPTSSRSK